MNFWRLRRKLHISWLLAITSASIVVGVISVQYINQSFFAPWAWLFTGTGLVLTVLWKRHVGLIPLIIVGGLLIGVWRGSIEQSKFAVYQKIYGAQVSLSGKVTDDADIGKSGEVVVRLSNIAVDKHFVAGKVWVSTAKNRDIKRGDIIFARGKLQSGFGNFSATMYRAEVTKVQRPEPGDVARRVRDWFADAVRVAIPEPQASLGIGYLVGQRRALPPDLNEALRIAGLTHVVVASGYNLTILVRFARRLFEKVSKYLSALSASVMIVSFVAITGLSPSMSRAGLIASLSLLAWYYGRKFHPLVLLPFAAAVTLIVSPSYGWNDLGWQLSFSAFAGVMIVAPLAHQYFFGDKKPGALRQILGETIAAQIVTLPLLIMAFGQFSNVAIVANLLVLPLVPLAMILTFAAGIFALVIPATSSIVGLPAEWLLGYMTSVAQYLSGLPWAVSEVSMNWLGLMACYILIISLCVYMWRKTGYNLREANLVE